MTNTHNHEITIVTHPDGTKKGWFYRGVAIQGLNKRSTRFAMKCAWITGSMRTELSDRTTIDCTMAKIDHLIDDGIRTPNAEGVMISTKDVK